jgi:hypothetical protein
MSVLYKVSFLICGPRKNRIDFLNRFKIECQKEILEEETDFFRVVDKNLKENLRNDLVHLYFTDCLKHFDIIKEKMNILKDLCTELNFGFLGYILDDVIEFSVEQLDNDVELFTKNRNRDFNEKYEMYSKIYHVHEIVFDLPIGGKN